LYGIPSNNECEEEAPYNSISLGKIMINDKRANKYWPSQWKFSGYVPAWKKKRKIDDDIVKSIDDLYPDNFSIIKNTNCDLKKTMF
jgi:hypothetical protein